MAAFRQPHASSPDAAGRQRLELYMEQGKQEIDKALSQYLGPHPEAPPRLWQAMQYMALDGGKRLRPMLLLAACEGCGGNVREALPMACAIEMLHIASLIHDDLPAMDNDDCRRGKPSLHKVYGEATAILAGDALIVYAFQIAAQSPPSSHVQQAIATLAQAAGAFGMAGGQALDLTARSAASSLDEASQPCDPPYLRKTAALIEAAVTIGGLCADASPPVIEALRLFGYKIGLAFQVSDDLLDYEVDAASGHANYCNTYGHQAARTQMQAWLQQAQEALTPLAPGHWRLHAMADAILQRRS